MTGTARRCIDQLSVRGAWPHVAPQHQHISLY